MSPLRKREWFENEALWRDMCPFGFPDSRIKEGKNDVDKVLRLTGIKKGAALDLCCGPGRCAVPLAKKKFAVTGVDLTKFYLNKARAFARAGRVKIEFIEKDMRDFVRPDSFDLVISMYTSFGYFADKHEDVNVLRNIHTSLRKGGALVIEMAGKEWLARTFAPTGVEEAPDGTLLVQRREAVDDWTRMRNQWIFIRKGRVKSYFIEHTVYSGQEIRTLMENVGFRKVKLYGSLDGAPYDRLAQRLVVVGRK